MLTQVEIPSRSVRGFEKILGPQVVSELERMAARLRQRYEGRVIWNVNSTASGGGVAELLHSLLAYARGLGIDTRWAVIEGSPEFFRITKRIHNALHGEPGDGSELGEAQRAHYDRTSSGNAAELCELVRPGDLVILHDPQTAGLIAPLRESGARVLWRCHVGADHPGPETDRAWAFLAPYLQRADGFVFTRPEYVPEVCDHGRSVIVPPSIDPFTPKNQELDEARVRAILAHADLVSGSGYAEAPVLRLEDGSTCRLERRAQVIREGQAPAGDTPLVLQVSRWDRLKDPVGVLDGFVVALRRPEVDGAHLMLVGPDVAGVSDDPEGAEVFREVEARWRGLPEPQRRRVHLVNLPMDDIVENALMVNALQRHATVVVQKSLREGFGLTVTEAMWKGRPVIGSAVGGIQDQIEHGVSGWLLTEPTEPLAFATALTRILGDPELARRLGRNARRRAGELFLVVRSLTRYAGLIEWLEA